MYREDIEADKVMSEVFDFRSVWKVFHTKQDFIELDLVLFKVFIRKVKDQGRTTVLLPLWEGIGIVFKEKGEVYNEVSLVLNADETVVQGRNRTEKTNA